METEKDNKLAFLDNAVLRELEGRLATSVYRKPTHTNQYLAYDSHHPQSDPYPHRKKNETFFIFTDTTIAWSHDVIVYVFAMTSYSI